MANILLIGSEQCTSQFLSIVSSDHTCSVLVLSEESAGSDLAARARHDVSGVEDLDAVLDLGSGERAERVNVLQAIDRIAGPRTIVFVNALTITATDAARVMSGRDGVLGISWTPGLIERSDLIESAPALQTSVEETERAVALLKDITGKEVATVVDRIGLVSARVLSMIINEAAFALMENVASAADIDTAMKLGTNYPEGPLAWADRIGAETVVNILKALHDEYGEERYRPCVLLKQYARAGKAFV